jgi:nucleoside-diphosphate-sugar epimerase
VRNVTLIGAQTSLGQSVARKLAGRDMGVAAPGQRADMLVHLESDDDASGDLAALRRALGAGEHRGVVYASSAMVYGAWPNNPVPLTEDAPMRPNPGFAYATAKAEAERVALEWRDGSADGQLAVLRPATVLGGGDGRLTRMLRDVLPTGVGDGIPPVQYLHEDDLADAVVLACEAGLDGVFNVAPDGWMSEEEARALTAGPLRVSAPARVRRVVPGLGPSVPAELLPYLVHPWVVANDRLRAAGWTPRYTSEEAFVAGAGVPGWQSLSLGRRQAIAFGGVGAAVAGAVGGAVALYRRRARK